MEPIFEAFSCTGFSWTDALDFFRMPHYSNDASPSLDHPYHFKFVQVYKDTTESGEPLFLELAVFLWANRIEPTQEECQAFWVSEGYSWIMQRISLLTFKGQYKTEQ
jgi:hypothetical protein